MTKTQVTIEEDLLVDLTFHDFSTGLLNEFVLKIVKPYFKGNLNLAMQTLMEKVLSEEKMFSETIQQ